MWRIHGSLLTILTWSSQYFYNPSLHILYLPLFWLVFYISEFSFSSVMTRLLSLSKMITCLDSCQRYGLVPLILIVSVTTGLLLVLIYKAITTADSLQVLSCSLLLIVIAENNLVYGRLSLRTIPCFIVFAENSFSQHNRLKIHSCDSRICWISFLENSVTVSFW